MTIETMELEDIRPDRRNPLLIPEAAIERVVRRTRRTGWAHLVVVEPDGTIVSGNMGFEVARRLGMKAIPVHVRRHA